MIYKATYSYFVRAHKHEAPSYYVKKQIKAGYEKAYFEIKDAVELAGHVFNPNLLKDFTLPALDPNYESIILIYDTDKGNVN